MADTWVVGLATLAITIGVRCTTRPALAGAVLGVAALLVLAGLRIAQDRLAAARQSL